MSTSTVEKTATQVAVNDIGSHDDLLAAIEATMKDFNDGDIVEGRIVKVDRDEVLLDIGYKTEGVIPSRELSIKHDVDPSEVVSVGDEVEALVLQKEDKEGRLILSLEHRRKDPVAVDEHVNLVARDERRAEQGAQRSRELRILARVLALEMVLNLLFTRRQIEHQQNDGQCRQRTEEDGQQGSAHPSARSERRS